MVHRVVPRVRASVQLAPPRGLRLATPPVRCSSRGARLRRVRRGARATGSSGAGPAGARVGRQRRRSTARPASAWCSSSATTCDVLAARARALHAFGLGLDDEEALAPWAIDDATDELYAHARRAARRPVARGRQPERALLGAPRLGALSPPRARSSSGRGPSSSATPAALAWLWANRDAVPLERRCWERLRGEALALSRTRFAAERAERGERGGAPSAL